MNSLIADEMVNAMNESPLTCQRDAGAFNPQQASRYETLRQRMLEAIQGLEELPNGYAFRFPAEPTTILTVAEFITLERRCCSFFNFVLEVEPENGPLWLRLTGGAGVKEFLRTELDIS